MSRFFDQLDRVEVEGPAARTRLERHLDLLADLGQELSSAGELEELARVVLHRLVKVTDADRGLLVLTDAAGAGARVFMGVDGLGATLLPEDLDFDRALLDDVIATGEARAETPGDVGDRMHTVVVVPLSGRTGCIGCLYAERSELGRQLSPETLAVARLVAAQAAPAFELQRQEEERRRADRVNMENAFLRRLSRRQTEQSRVVEELNEKLTRTSGFLENLLESSTEHAIIAIDLDGHITTWNTGAERTYGWTREEMIGHRLDQLLRPEDRRAGLLDEMTVGACGEAGRFSAEMVRTTRDDDLINVQIALTAIRGTDGEVHGFLDISRDVSSQHEMRRQLLMSEKMAALGTLAAGVAHEFNNLLQGITGFLGHALEREDPSQWERAMRVALEAANRASLLTGRLQAFARPEIAGLGPTHLPEVVDDTLALVERSFESEGVELRRESDDDLPPALVDRSRISQVLLNLLTNARHAVAQAEQRTVTVEVRRREPGWQEIVVRDTGCGIPSELQSRIFEPFFTTKGALGGKVFDGKVHGTGLGLAISNGIVTEHKGRLEVESSQDAGTTFRVLLPEAGGGARVSGTQEPPARDAAQGSERSLRILVVDDEELVRGWLETMLGERGHEVSVAADGREGLRVFGTDRFDVVIADWRMPGMDGSRFFREVASRSSAEDLPRRILITGRLETDEGGEDLPAGLDAVLRKPCTADQILAAVERQGRMSGGARTPTADAR